jgi:hypothetical protein
MQRSVPGALWVSLILLAAIGGIQLVLGLGTGNIGMVIAGAIAAVLVRCLYLGQPWAFVVTLAFAILGVLLSLAKGPAAAMGTLVVNGVIVGPMLLARDYFFGPRESRINADAAFCPRCGRRLDGPNNPYCAACGPDGLER